MLRCFLTARVNARVNARHNARVENATLEHSTAVNLGHLKSAHVRTGNDEQLITYKNNSFERKMGRPGMGKAHLAKFWGRTHRTDRSLVSLRHVCGAGVIRLL